VARPFTPLDALRLHAQQTTGTAFDIESEILLGRSPLRQALRGYARLGKARFVTLVLAPGTAGAPGGFVQGRIRDCDPAEADLAFIAPALASHDGAALAWGRLLAGACQHLGAKQVERVYVTVGEDDRVALQILRQLGFGVWTNDVVFVRPGGLPAPSAVPDVTTVDPTAALDHAIRSLVHESLPETVRANSIALGADWRAEPGGGYAPGPTVYRIWCEGNGTVRGAWRVVGGNRGHWLRIVARNGADTEALVRTALAEIARDTRLAPRPIHAAARGYEPELNLALRELGFEPALRRFHLVKHTTARVLAPAWRETPVREAALGRVPTSSAGLPTAPGAGLRKPAPIRVQAHR